MRNPASGPSEIPDIITSAVPAWIGTVIWKNSCITTVSAAIMAMSTISLALGFRCSNTMKNGIIVYISISALPTM